MTDTSRSQTKKLEMDLFSTERPMYYGTGEEIDVLKKYVPGTLAKISSYIERMFGNKPVFSDKIVAVGKLPTTRDKKGKPREKTFGLYQPGTGLTVYDRAIFPELNDPERQELKEYGLMRQKTEDVVGHEAVHHVQKKTGAIKNYTKKLGENARAYIEGMATKMTEYIFGRQQPIYATEQVLAKDVIRRHGLKKAFAGAF
jgi:hypothetical protein